MRNLIIQNTSGEPLDLSQIEESVEKTLKGKKLEKVLLIPPDFTRFHSMAGMIIEIDKVFRSVDIVKLRQESAG